MAQACISLVSDDETPVGDILQYDFAKGRPCKEAGELHTPVGVVLSSQVTHVQITKIVGEECVQYSAYSFFIASEKDPGEVDSSEDNKTSCEELSETGSVVETCDEETTDSGA